MCTANQETAKRIRSHGTTRNKSRRGVPHLVLIFVVLAGGLVVFSAYFRNEIIHRLEYYHLDGIGTSLRYSNHDRWRTGQRGRADSSKRILSDEDYMDRYLQFTDDDRHNNGPDGQDATNGPTIFGYTKMPSSRPTRVPSSSPSARPSKRPSASPSNVPSRIPSGAPTFLPSSSPSGKPSLEPTALPSKVPSIRPSSSPSALPSASPESSPSSIPTGKPTFLPSFIPSSLPSSDPSQKPSFLPSGWPSGSPEELPSQSPSGQPTNVPSVEPSLMPSRLPSGSPEESPSLSPSGKPTHMPSVEPSRIPSELPSGSPEQSPSQSPSGKPTNMPSVEPSRVPSRMPSASPEESPSQSPSANPTQVPTKVPSVLPSVSPSTLPTMRPSLLPSQMPSGRPTSIPTGYPTRMPSAQPSRSPTFQPSMLPSFSPSLDPCKGYDGSFGNVEKNEIVVSFMYGIESDRNVMTSLPATLSDQIREVEEALLDLLIEEFFPDCDLDPNHGLRRLNTPVNGAEMVHEEAMPRFLAMNHTVTGLKSSPIDLANGKKCIGDFANNIDYDADCNVIDGKMTVYLSDMVHASNVTSNVINAIKSIMDNKLLDDCHVAILRVMFIEPDGSRFISDDNFEIETISSRGRGGLWMIALGGVGILLITVVGTRYRYSSQFKDDGSGELKDKYSKQGEASEEFVEVGSSLKPVRNSLR